MRSNKVTKADDSDDKQLKLSTPRAKYKLFMFELETPVQWRNAIMITTWYIITIWALFAYPFWQHWSLFIYCIILGSIGTFGVTAGAHRYWAHRSYKATLPLRVLLLFCYCVAGQYSLKAWVRDHRVHHKFTDSDADPHNARRGFFFSHVGWLMMRKHPEVIRKGRTVDISDLFEDPLVVFYQKYYTYLKMTFCFILPSLIPVYLFEETLYHSVIAVCAVRYMVGVNFIMSVNSVAHLWGQRPYDNDYSETEYELLREKEKTTKTIEEEEEEEKEEEEDVNNINVRILPADNAIVSLLVLGEGYHNYHHTFPWDYRTSEIGRRFNFTVLLINIFKEIGWAYDLKTPSPELVKKIMVTHGDGSHMWGHEVPMEENSRFMAKQTDKEM